MLTPKEFWRLPGLEYAVREALTEIFKRPMDYSLEPGTYTYWLVTVSSGSAGIHQAREVADAFEMMGEIEREDWEEGEGYVLNEILLPQAIEYAKAATAMLHEHGFIGELAAGWHDADGDFGFTYIVDANDIVWKLMNGK